MGTKYGFRLLYAGNSDTTRASRPDGVLQQVRIAPWPDYATFAAKRFFVMTMSDTYLRAGSVLYKRISRALIRVEPCG